MFVLFVDKLQEHYNLFLWLFLPMLIYSNSAAATRALAPIPSLTAAEPTLYILTPFLKVLTVPEQEIIHVDRFHVSLYAALYVSCFFRF